MKKMIIALAVLGFTWAGAQAQTNKCVPARTAKTHKNVAYSHHHTNMVATSRTYRVCREEGGYYLCCLHKGTYVKPLEGKPVAVK